MKCSDEKEVLEHMFWLFVALPPGRVRSYHVDTAAGDDGLEWHWREGLYLDEDGLPLWMS